MSEAKLQEEDENEFYNDQNWNPNLKDFPPYNITDAFDIPYLGPSIDSPTKKKNPSGPFNFGLAIYGELDKRKLPNYRLGSEGFERCATRGHSANCHFRYYQLNARNMCLSNIDYLKQHQGLRNIDLSHNRLGSASALSGLQFLKILNLEKNKISFPGQIPAFPSLHALTLSRNLLTTTQGFQCQPCLQYLNLAYNQLTDVDGLNNEVFPSLKTLELRANKLISLEKLMLPKLQHLYAAKNLLTLISDIIGVPNIISFHARDNKIARLNDFPVMLQNLMYLNLRGNRVSKHTDLLLLGYSPLRALNLMHCPISGQSRYRLETITSIICLVRLDKELVKQGEVSAAMYLRKQRSLGKISPLRDKIATPAPPPSPTLDWEEEQRIQIENMEKSLLIVSPDEDKPDQNMKTLIVPDPSSNDASEIRNSETLEPRGM